MKADEEPCVMETLSPRARASDSSGIHRAIGPGDRWSPKYKMKASSVLGSVRMAMKPKPSASCMQSTVPWVTGMMSPEPFRQLRRLGGEVDQKNAFGQLDVAAH